MEPLIQHCPEELEYHIKRTAVDCGTEVSVSLIPKKQIRTDYVDICFPFESKAILFFSNGYCTNDFAEIVRIGEEELVSRDIAMFQLENGGFQIAMTSAERFFCRFYSTNRAVKVRVYLENKPLEKGKSYLLERFVYAHAADPGKFFDGYTKLLAARYQVKLPQRVESGWSSWSCVYSSVNEEIVKKQAEELSYISPDADMIQIDDGWQNGDTFNGDWTGSPERFPEGISALATWLEHRNKRLGLWISPTIMSNDGILYQEHPEYLIQAEEGPRRAFGGKREKAEENDGSVYPLDLENNAVLQYLHDGVASASEAYDCHYFKVDYLIRSILRTTPEDDLITYGQDFCVAVYRRAMKEIRDAAGKKAFLLACGAPITESVGIFDAIRTSPDITWRKNGRKHHPGYWYLIKKNAQNVLLRSYYRNVFITDPDAVLVRGELGEIDDDLAMTADEARVWATVTALSGGTMLVNELLEKLPEERKQILREVFPPIGVPAHPVNFFEYPYCSLVRLPMHEAVLNAAFNWEDEPKSVTIDTDGKRVLAFDCWSKSFLGEFNRTISCGYLKPHSVRAVVCRPCGNEPAFLVCDRNFYMGIDLPWSFHDNTMFIGGEPCGKVYVFCPDGYSCNSLHVLSRVSGGCVLYGPAESKIHFLAANTEEE